MSALRAVLGRYSEQAYALMRIIVALLYFCHGAQKLFGVLGGQPVWGGPPLFIAAGLIEVPAGLLMALGLFTMPAAFIASGEMAFAYFLDNAPKGFWPIENHGELPVLLCFVFLHIATRGAGIWSVDRIRGSRP
jgi:putative oxidoreductase